METTLEPEPSAAPSRVTWSNLRTIVALVLPYRWRLVAAALMLLGASGAALVYPRLARYAVDAMSVGAFPYGRFAAWLALVLVLQSVFMWLRHYLMSWLGERVVCDLRVRIVEHILRLSLGWFYERRTGELVGRLSADVAVIEGVVGSELSMAVRNSLQLIGSIVLLAVISPSLTLSMLFIVPPIVLITMAFGSFIGKKSKAVQDELARANGLVQESFGAIATVQAFAKEASEAAKYQRAVERSFTENLSLFRWRSSFFVTTSAAVYAGLAGLIVLAARAKAAGELSAGQLTEFFLYTFFCAGAVAELASLWGALQRASGATERVFAILATPSDIVSPPRPQQLPAGPGLVEFDHIHFAYPARPDAPVLRGVSFRVIPGATTAIVGASGSGKTTALQLLFRFFDPQSGAIRLDGADIRDLDLTELRQSLATVAQEPVLFAGTLADNIAYGRPNAIAADIEAAAAGAGAHDFISALPDRYQTIVGERGVKLSGGQRQRVAIARALLANPRVLVLDEATSNLDSESEQAVQAGLTRLMEGRTTILVAHRLSTVRQAAQIIVLKDGLVAEVGRHDDLLARRGVYAALVAAQEAVAAVAAER